MTYVIGFDDEQALDPQLVGQKFYSLARAYRAGFAVPQAVAISTAAHRYFLANNAWPQGLAEEVFNAAYDLQISRGLSIRSSATREDLEKQSFAGQYRSFLQVIDKKDLKENIEACWKSASSEAVQSYLQVKKQSIHAVKPPLMGVVIQKMVNAIAAGIAFGRNPMQPASNEIVIEAVEGLAEDLVSGRRSPYRAVVDADGMVQFSPPESKSHMNDETVRILHLYTFWQDIADLVRKLENHNGETPLDIEWAADGESKIWLLQSRPITTLDDSVQDIPAGLWTRKIANDLWADRLTPFLADHMVTKAPLFDLSRTLKILGISVFRPTLIVIHGYLYINCKNARTGLTYIPSGLQLPELNHLLPPSARANNPASAPIWKLVSIGLRSILLLMLEPGVNPFICLGLTKRHLKKISQDIDTTAGMPDTCPRETMRKIQSALELLSRLQIYNQWPYFFATCTTWILRWLAVDLLDYSHEDFLKRISQGADNVTIDIERNFRKMALEIARDSDLADRFKTETASKLAADLPPSIQTWLDGFLSQYGSRSRHRTLLIKRWIESPEEVVGILQSLVRNQQLHAAAKTQQTAADTVSPSTKVVYKSISLRAIVLSLLTAFNRRFLDLREDLRFALDRILHLLRQTLLRLGEQLGLGDSVMFLEENELKAVVSGSLSYRQARQIANRRQNFFMSSFDVPTYYNNGRAENEFNSEGLVMQGIGTSPGRVQGRAKIVDDPVVADIRSDHILIARNTDPGWTPILSIVKGMVMEEGGLLNHCSIVARELGIPSVVGVRGATRQIRDNDLVTIDGGLGVVKIEKS